MLSMGEAGSLPPGVGMLPYDMFEQPKPRLLFKMPRVVPDQKQKFETDELFRRLSRESEVRYTGYRDRPLEEKQLRFQNGCREGHTEIAFVATGTNIQLVFNTSANGYHHHHHHHNHHHPHSHHTPHLPNNSSNAAGRELDFEKEPGKVHLRSHFIMNGVCVRWRGWIDLDRLDGVGCLEFDEERAAIENVILREQIESYNQKIREIDDRRRSYRGAAMPTHPERGGNNGAGGGGGHGQSLETGIFN